jgi:predicted nucleic acid-binding protein
VLVALVDAGDDLHGRARAGLRALKRERFGITSAVLAESLFLLPRIHERCRLAALLDELAFVHVELEPPWWPDLFRWLDQYAEHEPDLADAQLTLLCDRDARRRVWTFDNEFKDVWRLSNGKPIPLARTR